MTRSAEPPSPSGHLVPGELLTDAGERVLNEGLPVTVLRKGRPLPRVWRC